MCFESGNKGCQHGRSSNCTTVWTFGRLAVLLNYWKALPCRDGHILQCFIQGDIPFWSLVPRSLTQKWCTRKWPDWLPPVLHGQRSASPADSSVSPSPAPPSSCPGHVSILWAQTSASLQGFTINPIVDLHYIYVPSSLTSLLWQKKFDFL